MTEIVDDRQRLERAQIVAFIRADAASGRGSYAKLLLTNLANSIERGDHLAALSSGSQQMQTQADGDDDLSLLADLRLWGNEDHYGCGIGQRTRPYAPVRMIAQAHERLAALTAERDALRSMCARQATIISDLQETRKATPDMMDAARRAWLEKASDYTRLDTAIDAAVEAVLALLPAPASRLQEQPRLVAARDALAQIKALKPEPIGDTGFAVGPAALFDAAQRIAREAHALIQAALQQHNGETV